MKKSVQNKRTSAGLWFLSATCFTASGLIGRRFLNFVSGFLCIVLGCLYLKEYNEEK